MPPIFWGVLSTAPSPRLASMRIQGNSGRHEIEDAHPAIEIEGALHLRQVVDRHERLLVEQQRAHEHDARKVDRTEPDEDAEPAHARNGGDVHGARDAERPLDAKTHWN